MKVTNMLPKDQQELFYKLALMYVPEIGPKTSRVLLSEFGSAEAIFKASAKELNSLKLKGSFTPGFLKEASVFRQAEDELNFIQKKEVQVLIRGEKGYPFRLMDVPDAPLLLFFKGAASLNGEKIVAVVGTRKNSDYGQRATEDFVSGLKGCNDLLLVSGLALGIDTIAHRACIKEGLPTVGVLGHGLDTVYPASNRQLAKEMLHSGGLLTEFPSGTRPNRENFPLRNRIVAGISDVTVIVESDPKGGAMITGYMAHSYNRDVAAFPGRIFDSKSAGPNLLIKRTMAALITNAPDLLALMNWNEKKGKPPVQRELLFELDAEQQLLFDALKKSDSLHADDLLVASNFSPSQLAAVLLQMEMQGLIKALPGKHYRLNV